MYVYLHILSFKFETKVRSMRVLNREEGAEAGKNGDGKGNMQIKDFWKYKVPKNCAVSVVEIKGKDIIIKEEGLIYY